MPLHDFLCGQCGQLLCDIYVPVQVRASEGAPLHCGRPMQWIAAAPAVHYGSVKTCAFRAFDTTDGYGRPVHIDSVQKLRKVERESEQAARNGEGQRMVWRRYAQDNSNKDQPTLSKDYGGGEQPSQEAKRRFGASALRSADAPEVGFGPGVNESNASALPMK